jgi:hypothetical protein
LVQRDYWDNIRKVRDNLAERIDKTERSTFTKKFVERLRMGRDLDAPMAEAGDDYGDYSKFESRKNSVTEKNDLGEFDDGSDKFLANYNHMMSELATEEGDRLRDQEKKTVEDVMSRMDTPNFKNYVSNDNLMQEFMNQRLSVDWNEEYVKFQAEKDFVNANKARDHQYNGRLSPVVKERIYRLYLKGATPKELSLRFGILADRVKAIVYQKHLYWEEVYPRLGETHMRLAMEMEAQYAAEFPFLTYGQDIKTMAELEKGIYME